MVQGAKSAVILIDAPGGKCCFFFIAFKKFSFDFCFQKFMVCLCAFVFVYMFLLKEFFSSCSGSLLLHRPFWSCAEWGLLSSCGVQAPGYVGSGVGAHGLSCSVAWGGLPGPGLEPVSLALAAGFLASGPPGKPCVLLFSVLQYV